MPASSPRPVEGQAPCKDSRPDCAASSYARNRAPHDAKMVPRGVLTDHRAPTKEFQPMSITTVLPAVRPRHRAATRCGPGGVNSLNPEARAPAMGKVSGPIHRVPGRLHHGPEVSARRPPTRRRPAA